MADVSRADNDFHTNRFTSPYRDPGLHQGAQRLLPRDRSSLHHGFQVEGILRQRQTYWQSSGCYLQLVVVRSGMQFPGRD
ncbi:MAG: hypothetical protein Ct9H300mP25_12650 [Acidobacteriota bacterium]|nr:MAG: hypothetical protein Ct9H300mP25_12650 [Acidobacteriota bacterium]